MNGVLAGRVALVTGAGAGIGEGIAPVAVFLASEASRYLTGNTLFADGGSHINGVAWAPDLDA